MSQPADLFQSFIVSIAETLLFENSKKAQILFTENSFYTTS